jgi:hypothetical protein
MSGASALTSYRRSRKRFPHRISRILLGRSDTDLSSAIAATAAEDGLAADEELMKLDHFSGLAMGSRRVKQRQRVNENLI